MVAARRRRGLQLHREGERRGSGAARGRGGRVCGHGREREAPKLSRGCDRGVCVAHEAAQQVASVWAVRSAVRERPGGRHDARGGHRTQMGHALIRGLSPPLAVGAKGRLPQTHPAPSQSEGEQRAAARPSVSRRPLPWRHRHLVAACGARRRRKMSTVTATVRIATRSLGKKHALARHSFADCAVCLPCACDVRVRRRCV